VSNKSGFPIGAIWTNLSDMVTRRQRSGSLERGYERRTANSISILPLPFLFFFSLLRCFTTCLCISSRGISRERSRETEEAFLSVCGDETRSDISARGGRRFAPLLLCVPCSQTVCGDEQRARDGTRESPQLDRRHSAFASLALALGRKRILLDLTATRL